MNAAVKRTTLVVRNVERSMAFYRDVLGFTTAFDQEIVMSGGGYPAGKAGDRVRLVMLHGGDPSGSMIGLLEHLDPRLPEPARRPVGIGNCVMVLETADLQEVERSCETSGGSIFSRPHSFTMRRPGGKPVKMLSMTILDPDGFILEVNQRPG